MDSKMIKKLHVTREDPIHILELVGVCCAVQMAPANCGLRVITDN